MIRRFSGRSTAWSESVVSSSAGHRVTLEWMGAPVVTLADLLPAGVRVVCVGVNPTPESVAAGHYYQDVVGRRFYHRLAQSGLLPDHLDRHGDDVALARGVGFTDLVKRPTNRYQELTDPEIEYGRALLASKVADLRPRLVILSGKKVADLYAGRRIAGLGFIDGFRISGIDTFVMSGSLAPDEGVKQALRELRAWIAAERLLEGG